MPPTPSPFRLPSQRPRSASARTNAAARGPGLAFRSPASSGAGRQFASTPRFVLPGSTPIRSSRDEIDSSDHEGPSSPVSRPSRREPGTTRAASSQQKDAIEDSEDEDLNLPDSPVPDAEHEVSESRPYDGGNDLVAEFDEIFPPTPDRAKRRRVSADPEIFSTYHGRSHLDPIQSSPSDPPSPSERRNASPPPSALPRIAGSVETPAPRRSISATTTETPQPATSIAAKTPFRVPPRSTFSASQSASRPSPQIRFGSRTPAPQSPPQRKKPAFVLPRSPSPSHQSDDHSIPAPFSPSSRSLRRGRPRSNISSYVAGGMASQVRSWILETAATREHMRRVNPTSFPNSTHEQASAEHERFFLTAEVLNSSQGTLNSGPCAVVKGRSAGTQPLQPRQDSSSQERNLLLVGPSQSRPPGMGLSTAPEQTLKLNKGDMVGVHHGLAWEFELSLDDAVPSLEARHIQDSLPPSDSRPSQLTREQHREKWLVGLEWELLR
ncbi:hypothetical protein Plec18167_006607 [Paecilomyces lecythidis]|uniref:Uncharacterized protein n=1 Tax=Paecilomyces lecythidis TaxID=3004212 RepID=A0ABR3XA01_9EURO